MDGVCAGCGKSVLFIREAVYDGFTKTGELLKCSQCGHIVEGEASEVLEAVEAGGVLGLDLLGQGWEWGPGYQGPRVDGPSSSTSLWPSYLHVFVDFWQGMRLSQLL